MSRPFYKAVAELYPSFMDNTIEMRFRVVECGMYGQEPHEFNQHQVIAVDQFFEHGLAEMLLSHVTKDMVRFIKAERKKRERRLTDPIQMFAEALHQWRKERDSE